MSRNHLILIAFLFLSAPSVFCQNRLIWDGEVPTDTCQNEWGKKTDSIAHSGTYCFMGIPDPWHGPGIKLHCTPSWRVNLSIYNELHFWVKANTNTPRALNLGVYGWPNVSRSIDITPYLVGGGTINSDWKEVRVPLDSLKTTNFQLGVSEILYFGGPTPPNGYRFFIDDIWAVDTKPTKVTGTKIISDKTLRINIADRFDTSTVKNTANYFVTSPDDGEFSSPQYPTQISMHYYVEDFDKSDNYNNPIPIINYQLYLGFNKKLKNGKTYTLNVTSIKDMSANEFTSPYSNTFIFNDLEVTGSVKANHVGYLPNRSKYGYIGNFLGGNNQTVVPLSITTAPSFEIRRTSDNSTVYTGTAVLRQNFGSSSCNDAINTSIDTRWSGEIVYSCDFSNVTSQGEYYLYSAGYGRSYSFRIAADVYDDAARTVVRSLYLNRCGIELAPQYAGVYNRPICHAADGVLHSSVGTSPLNDGEIAGTNYASPRGWHDAGDYGKYVASAAQPVHDIFLAYEMFPEKFPDGFANIPESGNGVPDILDEVKWEIDWLLTMQAPDGGGYFKICTSNWPNWMPQNDNATRWIAEKTTHSTAHITAMLAAAARIFRPFFPVYADTCLAKARRGWAWLDRHLATYPTDGYHNPSGMGGGEYGDPGETSDLDERAWAAAELYKTTGESFFHDKFTFYWTQNGPIYGWNAFQHHQLKASYVYATTKKYPTNATYINSFKNAIKVGIEQYEIPRLDKSAYRSSYRSEVIPWIAWGAWGYSMALSWNQIKASYLLSKDYSNSAAINLDVQLGNNPQNRSYITAVGYDYPMDPLHHPSNTDGIVEPYPGQCVFGPHANMGSLGYAGSGQSLNNLYPAGHWDCAPMPALRRYYDAFEFVAMSEGTRSAEALSAVVLAYFSSQNAPILGVELLDFHGFTEGKNNRLTFHFADTKDLDNIEIQKSMDGKTFTPLSNLIKNEELKIKNGAEIIDTNPFDLTYYRLKINEINGSSHFSKTIALHLGEAKTFKILSFSPNPTNTFLDIQFENPIKEATRFEVFNALGQLVFSEKTNTSIGSKRLNTEGLPVGVYALKISSGQTSETHKFLKNF